MNNVSSKNIPSFFWYVIAICVFMLSSTVCYVAYKASSIRVEYEGKIIRFEREKLANDLETVIGIAEKIEAAVPSLSTNITIKQDTNNDFTNSYPSIGPEPFYSEDVVAKPGLDIDLLKQTIDRVKERNSVSKQFVDKL